MQLGVGVVCQAEELVDAAKEEAALLVRVAEQSELSHEQSLPSGWGRRGRRSERLGVVVGVALELLNHLRRCALIDLEQR